MIQSYTTNNYPIVYSDHRPLLSDRYGVIRVQGVVVANEWATVNTNSGESALLEGKTVDLYIRKATILADSVVYGDPIVSDINTVVTTGEHVVYGDPASNSDEVGYEDLLSDNDGDGEVDYVLSVEKVLTDVTAYNTNRETVTLRQVGTIDFEDMVG